MEIDNQANPEDCTALEDRLSALSINSFNDLPEALIKPIQDILSNQYQNEIKGLNEIKMILSLPKTNYIDDVIKSGIVPTLMRMALTRPHEFAYQLCWVICNIGCGDSLSTRYLIRINTLDFFDQIFYLEPNSYELCDQIVWAIGNIAGDCTNHRNIVSSSNVFNKILAYAEILPLDQTEKQSNLAWTMTNLVRGKPIAKVEITVSIKKHLLKVFLYFNDFEILTDACWGLYSISEIVCKNLLKNPNIAQKILSLLINQILQTAIPLFNLLGNIIVNCDNSWDYLNELNILNVILNGMACEKKALRKVSICVLSKLCSKFPQAIQLMIEQKVFGFLFDLMKKEDNVMKKEIFLVFYNSINVATSQQIGIIFKKDGICVMIKLLLLKNQDTVKSAILESIIKIMKCLENCYGDEFLWLKDKLQDLCYRDENFTENYNKLVELLREKGFDRNDEGEF